MANHHCYIVLSTLVNGLDVAVSPSRAPAFAKKKFKWLVVNNTLDAHLVELKNFSPSSPGKPGGKLDDSVPSDDDRPLDFDLQDNLKVGDRFKYEIWVDNRLAVDPELEIQPGGIAGGGKKR
jgi:hypothetical protein